MALVRLFARNFILLLVLGPMFPIVKSKMFSTTTHNFDLSTFAIAYIDADATGDAEPVLALNTDTDLAPNFVADADTDIYQDLKSDEDFELIF